MNTRPQSDLQAISRAQLERSLTQAQITVARHQLHSCVCPVCDLPKEYRKPLCRRCFFSLPEDMRPRVCFPERYSEGGLELWVAVFNQAKEFLRAAGLGQGAA